MPAPLTIGQAADLVDLSIQKIYPKSSTPAEQYKTYFNYRTTTDYYEKDSGLSGLGEADFVDENGVVTVDVPIQTYDKTYTQNQVDHMVTFSKRMWRFGIQKRTLDNFAKELKDAIRRKKERLCAERLDNGFESISYTHSAGGAKSRTISTAGGDGLGALTLGALKILSDIRRTLRCQRLGRLLMSHLQRLSERSASAYATV